MNDVNINSPNISESALDNIVMLDAFAFLKQRENKKREI